MEEGLKEAHDECKRLQGEMEGLEAAHELQYYRAMEKERRRWEERKERLLSRLEAAPVPRPDLKPDSGSLSVHEKEALIEELTEVKNQLEDALQAKEGLSQQLDVAEQGKAEAEKQIEKQQLKIEELQAELHLAEVRAKRVERETLAKGGDESTMEGDGAGKSPPASPVSGTSVGRTTGKTPPAKEKHMEASPSADKTAATTEITVPPPKLPRKDACTSAKEGEKPGEERKGVDPPTKELTSDTPSTKAGTALETVLTLLDWDQHMGCHSSRSFLVKTRMGRRSRTGLNSSRWLLSCTSGVRQLS